MHLSQLAAIGMVLVVTFVYVRSEPEVDGEAGSIVELVPAQL